MPPDSHSVTRWIEQLRQDDPRAAAALWERFIERMLAVARQRLRNVSRRVADEEDVAVVAFERFLAGARQGRFPRLNDRNDLWAVLFTLTDRHAARQARDLRRQKRGGGEVRGHSALGEVVERAVDEPTPAEAVLLQDSLGRLLDVLHDEELRQIALACLEGSTSAEIAARIGRSVATVDRRRRLIREIWQRQARGGEKSAES
jgi:DNA-directed RNA polymerase specialized sigma24 family protein